MDSQKKKFCCILIESLIEDPDCTLHYNPYLREYYLQIPNNFLRKSEVYPKFRIKFCPRCGTQLPKPLIHEWQSVVEKIFHIGVNSITKNQLKKLPKEFKTEQWWRKRGL